MHLMLSQSPHFFSYFFLYPLPWQWFPPFCLLAHLFIFLPHLFCYWFLILCFFFWLLFISACLNFLFVKHFFCLLDLCLHSFPKIFTITTVNSFSGQLPISTLLSCSSGVLFRPFVWNIFLCCFILSHFLCLQSHRLQHHSSSCFWCLSPSRHGFFFVFGSRRSFLSRFHFFFVNGCSAVSCDFDVFVRAGGLRSFYSTILSGQASQQIFSEPAPLCQGLCQSWGTTTELQSWGDRARKANDKEIGKL